MEENTIDLDAYSDKRPTFLTILCILTWIGSATAFYNGIDGLVGGGPEKKLQQLMAQADKVSGQRKEVLETMISFMGDHLEELKKSNIPISVVTLLGALGCAFGAYLMWNRQKKGLYWYAISELLPIIVTYLLIGQMMTSIDGPDGLWMKGGIYGSMFFSFLMVILYGLNLKHLK